MIEVGLFRFVEQVEADETSAITTLQIGIVGVNVENTFEDWNEMAGDEDWGSGSEVFEDWSDNVTAVDNFNLEYMPTDDGLNPQFQGVEDLEVVENLGSVLVYSPDPISSIFHRLKLAAVSAGQRFYLKVIEMGGLVTGRRL